MCEKIGRKFLIISSKRIHAKSRTISSPSISGSNYSFVRPATNLFSKFEWNLHNPWTALHNWQNCFFSPNDQNYWHNSGADAHLGESVLRTRCPRVIHFDIILSRLDTFVLTSVQQTSFIILKTINLKHLNDISRLRSKLIK